MNADTSARLPQIREFFDSIRSVRPAYRYRLLSFVAVIHEGETVILRARMRLCVESPALQSRTVTTPSLRAVEMQVNSTAEDIESWVSDAALGSRLPPMGEYLLKLLPESLGGTSAYYERPQSMRVSQSDYLCRLVLNGANVGGLVGMRSSDLERELHSKGYDSLNELIRDYGFDRSDQTAFEIVAEPAARIDDVSQLRGRRAEFVVRLPQELHTDQLHLTIRNADRNGPSIRYALGKDEITWKKLVGHYEGLSTIDLPYNSIIDCRAVYDGCIQTEVQLTDLDALPNKRRMMLEVADPGLQHLHSLLTDPRGDQSKEFEAGIALLFQMLGFSPAYIGSMSGKMQQEPDILIAGPGDHFFIVECTVGVPDDDKFTRLISRAARAREKLSDHADDSIFSQQVTTVLVTPRPPEELALIFEKADEHRILVLSRPEIASALKQTAFAPNASAVLKKWRDMPLEKIMTGGLKLI